MLRALGLWQKEEDEEGPPSAVSSPRSPRSPRSDRSPRSVRSPRSPGANPESGRFSPGRGSPRAKGSSGLKLKKNLGSVTALLRRATRGDSPSNSPNSSPRGSPRSDGAPSSGPGLSTARALQQSPARFARLADGTRVDIATVRRVESPGRSGRNQSPRSPGRAFSPRSPGRGASPRNDALKADANRRGMRVNDDWKIQVPTDELDTGEQSPQEVQRPHLRSTACVCQRSGIRVVIFCGMQVAQKMLPMRIPALYVEWLGWQHCTLKAKSSRAECQPRYVVPTKVFAVVVSCLRRLACLGCAMLRAVAAISALRMDLASAHPHTRRLCTPCLRLATTCWPQRGCEARRKIDKHRTASSVASQCLASQEEAHQEERKAAGRIRVHLVSETRVGWKPPVEQS